MTTQTFRAGGYACTQADMTLTFFLHWRWACSHAKTRISKQFWFIKMFSWVVETLSLDPPAFCRVNEHKWFRCDSSDGFHLKTLYIPMHGSKSKCLFVFVFRLSLTPVCCTLAKFWPSVILHRVGIWHLNDCSEPLTVFCSVCLLDFPLQHGACLAALPGPVPHWDMGCGQEQL